MLRKKWLALFILIAADAHSATTQATFKVSAQIIGGCWLGSSSTSPTTNFGTLDFGTMTAITSNVDISSAPGAGSISVACTPGMSVAIALDYGVNGGSSSGRFLANGNGNTLPYQLYQNAERTQVWGSNAQAYSISSFPPSAQTYIVYGRLFPVSGLPPSGTYTDTITVTLTY